MGKLLCRLFAVAVLVGALINFSVVFKNSPALNDSERLESVAGGWRVPIVAAHYDRAEYRLQLAYGYLNELGLTYDPETEQMGLISPEEMNARSSKALELIEQSILLDPSNASAWAYLAQAQSRLGEIDAMRESLERSWALAPHNLQLAPLRLLLVTVMDQHIKDKPETLAPLSANELAAMRRDGEVLRAKSPRHWAGLIESSEPIRTLLGDLGSGDEASS